MSKAVIKRFGNLFFYDDSSFLWIYLKLFLKQAIIYQVIKIQMRRIFDNKITKYLKQVWEELQNQKQNREVVGVDRDGNKYFQYYSYYGLPTRREIRFKLNGNYDITDLVYYNWLYKIQMDPPTQQEKQQFYLEEKLRYQRALEWDNKQKQINLLFKQKRQELLLRDKNLKISQSQIQISHGLTNLKTKRDYQVNHQNSQKNDKNNHNVSNQYQAQQQARFESFTRQFAKQKSYKTKKEILQ